MVRIRCRRASAYRATRGLAPDTPHLDLGEVFGEPRRELFGQVLVYVVRVLPVRGQQVGCADQDRAVGTHQTRDLGQVGSGVFEVFDHLEAHGQIELRRSQRDAAEVGPQKVEGVAPRLAVGSHPVDADDEARGRGQVDDAVARAAAEVEHARPRTQVGRDLVGRAVPRQVDAEQAVALVQPLPGERDLAHASASRMEWDRLARQLSSEQQAERCAQHDQPGRQGQAAGQQRLGAAPRLEQVDEGRLRRTETGHGDGQGRDQGDADRVHDHRRSGDRQVEREQGGPRHADEAPHEGEPECGQAHEQGRRRGARRVEERELTDTLQGTQRTRQPQQGESAHEARTRDHRHARAQRQGFGRQKARADRGQQHQHAQVEDADQDHDARAFGQPDARAPADQQAQHGSAPARS